MALMIRTQIAACALILCATVAAEERRYTLLEREIEYLVDIWPGSFDNREQVNFEAPFGLPAPADAVPRLHLEIARESMPDLGEYVLSVSHTTDPAQRRLFVLSADEDAGAVRVRQHTADDASYLDGCDLLLRRDTDWIAGGADPDSCSLADEWKISETQVWTRRVARDQDTNWSQLERARWFACMVDFPRPEGGPPSVTHHYIKIHDQGGAFSFSHPDGRSMVLTMRNTWSYGMQRETFVIVVQDGDESGPTLVYAWGEPGSDRIGMNPGYLRIQCDLDTPRHVRMQHWLRPDS